MARLAEFPEAARVRLENLECPHFEELAWVPRKPMSNRRVAIVSTAGLQRRGDQAFDMGSGDFRVIPDDTPAGDIVMSHISTNFDRSGFQQDINIALPVDRLRELAARGEVGSVADYHYSFMGATDPRQMRPHAERMIEIMASDSVDTALLVPI